jgi:phage shock protein C
MMNISDEIKRLHELHQAGALNDAEFEQAKARLLSGVNLNKPGEPAEPAGADLASQIGMLRRSRSDRWLGGVCGGLGRLTGVESWIWRLMFALVVLCGGFGVVVYILMWIFVPEE